MGTVVLDMTMSLNGCVAGPDGEDAGLHDWHAAWIDQKVREHEVNQG